MSIFFLNFPLPFAYLKLGSTAIGIQTKDGVVLAVEKRLTSPLMVSTSVEKLFEIDSHVGCAVSGLTADAKMLVEHARVEAQVNFKSGEQKIELILFPLASYICL